MNVPIRMFALAFLIISCGPTAAADAQDDAQDDTGSVIEPTGEVEKVHGGFGFTEGPAWDARGGVLYFSDIPNMTIHALDAEDQLSSFTDQSNYTNGMRVASDGRLLACQMAGQVVAYDTETAEAELLASEYEGKRFNAPNDLVNDSDGGIYFTDPRFRAPEPLPQGVQAVYYIGSAGDIRRVTGDLPAPNGVALSPDGKQLYVIPSHQDEMLVYDVTGPGEISKQRVLCRLKQAAGTSERGGDGLAVDVQGNVYITSHLGVQIFSSEGKPRGIVRFPEQPANAAFGGADRKTLYVTARSGLYRVAMPIAGVEPN